ncbi:IPP transferase, partial [Trifolium medium]|nr:IPP transferase [Trifolium medium]
KNQSFVWDDQCEKSFQELKKILTSAPVLILPNPKESFVVYYDAKWSSGCVCIEAIESS